MRLVLTVKIVLCSLICGGAIASDELYKVRKIIGEGWTNAKKEKPGFFNHPQSVALDKKGNIYVVDRENHRIQAFHPDGKYYMTIGEMWNNKDYTKPLKHGPYFLRHPFGVTIDNDSIYVTDWAKGRVLRYGLDGKFVSEWGGETMDNQPLIYPSCIYADGEGKIYIGHEKKMSSDNAKPMIYDRDGKFLGFTKLPGQYGFVKAPDGTFFQTYQSRVYKLDKEGNLIGWVGRSHLPSDKSVVRPGAWVPAAQTYPNGDRGGWWCSAGSGEREFREPRALAIDSKRKWLFVCDMMNHRVEILDLDGNYIGQIGGRGSGKGEFHCPSGIAVDDKGDLYVVDKYNNRVQIFSPVNE